MDNTNNNYGQGSFNYGYDSFFSGYGLNPYEQDQNLGNANMQDQGGYENFAGYGAQAFQSMQNGFQYMGEQVQNVLPPSYEEAMAQLGRGVQNIIPEAVKNAGVGMKEKISSIFNGFIAQAKQMASSVVSNRLFKVAVVVVAVGLIVTGVALAKTVLTIGCIVLAVLLAKRIFDAVAGR